MPQPLELRRFAAAFRAFKSDERYLWSMPGLKRGAQGRKQNAEMSTGTVDRRAEKQGLASEKRPNLGSERQRGRLSGAEIEQRQ